ncbi:GATA zinc finger domain-containing protein 14-like [Ostrinia furnacalis]|uniref:GATA zinc finger domain-containing protein 14-like n=1 Tax=Ostrinia furnacalis TaxID=93504 RepID=UPI00103CEB89|nr:GATA zinc finger domain-containing protein 14-like [Ostrinia furnacalis]
MHITDAVIFNKNETGCISESSNNTNKTESGQEKQDSTQNDNNCNITNEFKPTQSANLITLDISANISSNNTPTKAAQDCGDNGDILSEECHNKLKATNEIPNPDTVLKYVYKKNDKIVNEKPKGHPLNSVRRKRSTDIKNNAENITADASLKAPIIVDYETAHAPRGREVEQLLPVHHRVTDNTIKNSALADFNIETLHGNNQTPKNDNLNKDSSSSQSEEDKESSENKNYSRSDSRESSESDYLRDSGNSEKQTKKSSESDESGEKEEYRKSAEDSREVTDDDRPAPQKEKSAFTKYQPHPQSFENYESKEYPTRNKAEFSTPQNEKYENNEKYNSKSTENSGSSESSESSAQDTDPKKSSYKEREDDSRESSEKEKYRHNDSSREQHSNEKPDSKDAYKYPDDSSQSRENSNESNNDGDSPTNDRLSNKDYIQGREINLSTPRTIQDVDLDDFSYERVKVDDKGKILPTTDHDDPDSPAPKPLVTPDTDQNLLTGSLSLSNEEQISGGLFDNAKPVHINDGEVKPVVEINSENNEGESFDENSKEALKTNPDKDASLETILGTSINDAEEQNEKIVQNKEPEEKADVKQQFERIPLNYKHENKQEESDKSSENDSKNNPQEENANEENQGTLDIFSPKDVSYDEHLKFKFDDIAIKLPEIKLPEDILAYTYEEPSYEKKKDKYEKRKHKKPKFYHYSDEVSEETPRDEKKSRHSDDDNERDYYGHSYDKQNLKKKDDDEDDEDLYEKFVRERFGKRGSFEKRSEKLEAARDLPYNPELYQRVQNILKKSAQIDKQAQKSGDPNAGYAWTLEYGENLK